MPTVVQIKAAVRARDGHRCTGCGMTAAQHHERYGKNLDVHRTIPGSLYTLEGCVTICKRCHGPQPRRKKGQRDQAYNYSLVAIPLALYEALSRYAEDKSDEDTDRSISWAGRKAVRQFLEEAGYWPPPADDSPPPR